MRGFMTLAPLVEDPEDVRYVFAKLRTIRDRLRESWSPHFDLSELSMGMSGDYEVAVEEGATVVRIGRMLIRGGWARKEAGWELGTVWTGSRPGSGSVSTTRITTKTKRKRTAVTQTKHTRTARAAPSQDRP